MSEFDRIGRDAFLAQYGFRPAKRYFLRGPSGHLYDSKAIVGAAYGYQFPDRGPLTASQFSGGEATVKAHLERLQFDVSDASSSNQTDSQITERNPPWIRDELILALDLYMRLKGAQFTHESPEIVTVSRDLNRLHQKLGTARSETLRRFDPTFIELGRRGLERGNQLEGEVWAQFGSDPSRLAVVAGAIRDQIRSGSDRLVTETLSDDLEAPEGRLLARLHHTGHSQPSARQ